MSDLYVILDRVKVPPHQLTSETIQDVLVRVKKQPKVDEKWNEIADAIWGHLKTGLNKFDDQLLCATCFYSVLTITNTNRLDLYLEEISHFIGNVLDSKLKSNSDVKTPQAVSIMYGMFQSAFLTQNFNENSKILIILKLCFDLLTMMAYEYTRYTYIVFKTINSFKKVCGTQLQQYIFNQTGQIKLLSLVCSNWENPITGVKDLNRGIFQTLLSVMDGPMLELIMKEINEFYWNKAKYLMLAEIIEQHKQDRNHITQQYDWILGLMYSLHKPGLVSAGADMYYAILKRLRSDDEWTHLFLNGIIDILTGTSSKAIDNFSNYWCLTTFKKFPYLAKILMDKLLNYDDSEMKLYSIISVMKQANKLGIIEKDLNSDTGFKLKEILESCGIEHCNPYIRMLAFDIVCVSHNKTMPPKTDYVMIMNYLQNNVNSDSTVLRLNMLNSLTSFLTRLQSAFLYNSKNDKDFEDIVYFCVKIQDFLIQMLSMHGNYQRRITCVKICKLFLDSLNNVHKRKQRLNNLTLIKILEERDCWVLHEEQFVFKLLNLLNDPSDDVREHVVKLLLAHYLVQIRCKPVINHLIDNAIKSIQSKYFYEISCGTAMFKLIANILVIENCTESHFSDVEDLFLYAYKEMAEEFKAKTDIIKSIETGKQLHSLISILQVILEACFQKHKTNFVSDNLEELISMLEVISSQFAWEEAPSTSSDFSKMSDMVQNIIESSGVDHDDCEDQTRLSGLHQIVLNCLWLNVKASCDLAALLIQFANDSVHNIEKCLGIITRVLETCRHKGAIEAAGVALGRAIQYLTSLPEESTISKLPYSLLRCKLKELISETGAMSSITRRGAGLSIMVHRIVSSDMKKGKPLFHYFMATLLEACETVTDVPIKPSGTNENKQRDLPKAVYIHFLTRIVTDSSLASDMMNYSAKLAELAFDNLTSVHWQIRNAALQLYGALIPKLIGQKKASGSDEETIATVACDEFRKHSPRLWTHIEENLTNIDNSRDKVQAHSNLVPILNILANSAKRYTFTIDKLDLNYYDNLLPKLISLLHSPIYTVRRLTAKCISNIFSFGNICDTILKQDIKSENFRHGILILLNYCHKIYSLTEGYQSNVEPVREKLSKELNTDRHSYLCRQIYEEIFVDENIHLKVMQETLTEVHNNFHSPGVFLWADKRIEKCIENAKWVEVPDILKTILDNNCVQHCAFILRKIKLSQNAPKTVLMQMACFLLEYEKRNSHSIIWEILYEISLQYDLSHCVPLKSILEDIKQKLSTYNLRFAIPFIARVSRKPDELYDLSKIINRLSDTQTSDVDMRYIAALANNELATNLQKCSLPCKINAIKSAVLLLQDEDEDLRCLSAIFYNNIKVKDSTVVHINFKDSIVINPYIVLVRILDKEFLHSYLQIDHDDIDTLYHDLCEILDNTNVCSDKYNPFANDSKNIFIEVDVIKKFMKQ